jgi:hypothetical protein
MVGAPSAPTNRRCMKVVLFCGIIITALTAHLWELERDEATHSTAKGGTDPARQRPQHHLAHTHAFIQQHSSASTAHAQHRELQSSRDKTAAP